MIGARIDDDPVGLERLPLAAAVAPLAPLELAVDELGVERDARGEPFDDRRQGRPVRLAGGQVAEHGVVHFQGNGWPVRSLVGLDVLLAGPGHHVVGQARRRARLVPAGRLEPVADELLVERRLRAAGLVRVRAASSASCRG